MNDQHPDDPTGAPEGSEPSIQVPDDASSITDAAPEADEVTTLTQALGERTADLQRLQAEYVNYKRRVDRDRHVARQAGIDQVLGAIQTGGEGVSMFQPAFTSGRGKSFFIHDLLKRVVIPEQGWVSHDRNAVRRAMVMNSVSLIQ